jgi:hypothetical protein
MSWFIDILVYIEVLGGLVVGRDGLMGNVNKPLLVLRMTEI